jgi:hypothetical protein
MRATTELSDLEMRIATAEIQFVDIKRNFINLREKNLNIIFVEV